MSESNKKLGGLSLSNFLYENAKRGKWEAVVKMYEEQGPDEAQRLKLTHKGDTALHLAVIDNQEDIVVRVVKLITRMSHNKEQLLSITNERQNSPLHLAAVMGSVTMCQAIASAHPKLVDMRNKVDETPMFLAAAYGHTNAFYCLYYFRRHDLNQIDTNCRIKTNGDTVLHIALKNERFDLAFQLIHMNERAKNWVNEQGLTPLHILASKPTSFKSGAHIRGWRTILYYCAYVEELKAKTIESLKEDELKKSRLKEKTTSHFPPNYQTCIDFFFRLKDTFLKVTTLKRLLEKMKNEDDEEANKLGKNKPHQSVAAVDHIENFPENYDTCIDIFRIVFTAFMIILGFGSTEIRKVMEKKQKHKWSVQVMEKLLEFARPEKYGHDGKTPLDSKFQTDEDAGITLPYSLFDDEVQFSNDVMVDTNKPTEKPNHVLPATETAMLLAAKNGVIEIVKGMFESFPLAIRETRKDKKNVVLLAAEYRQPDVYRFLLKKKHDIESLFRAVDNDGNSALHLAATAIDHKLWRISGAALQMQWEVKWYKYVKESMPLHFFAQYNKKGKTANEIFHESHLSLVKKGKDWLYGTSESCSVVATLITTVAFASANAIPGGYNDGGAAILETNDPFFMFAISSLIALCFSSTSVIMFLGILTSRFETKSFGSSLPWKLLIGLSCLYFSIIAMLLSFCTAHNFLVAHRLHNLTTLLYTLTFLPVAFIFAIVQLPLYLDLLLAILKIVPKRSADVLCN